jgi:cytochrome c-type biogenesis protein CcmH/NrfG
MALRKLALLSEEDEAVIRRLFLKGMEHSSKDHYSAAILEWEKILKIDPTNESVKRNIEEARERRTQLERR